MRSLNLERTLNTMENNKKSSVLNERFCLALEKVREERMDIDGYHAFLDVSGLCPEDMLLIEMGMKDVPLLAASILIDTYGVSWDYLYGKGGQVFTQEFEAVSVLTS